MTPISPEYTRGDLIAMIHQRDALVSGLKEVCTTRAARIEALEAALNQTSDLAQELCVACRSEVPDKQFLNWAHDKVGVKILDIYNSAIDQKDST